MLMPCYYVVQCTTRHRPFARPEPRYYDPCPAQICTLYAFRWTATQKFFFCARERSSRETSHCFLISG